LVINGDGCDPKILEEAEIKKADVVAAVTQDDEDNLIICQLAKDIFGVTRTVARVNDPKNTPSFSALGVDVPVDSTAIIARIIEEEASFSDFISLLTFKKGRLSVVRVDLSEESPAVNKKIKEMRLPFGCALVSIMRRDELLMPKDDLVLRAQDEVIALTTIENEQKLVETLLGKI
jgi:trk system potassium uptake protein TrkA